MVVTVAIVVLSHNLAYGVAAGVVLSAIFFARHVSGVVKVTSVVDPDVAERLYAVSGELFFASSNQIVHAFDYDEVKAPLVEIDLSQARIWDTSAVAALDTVVAKFADRGIEARLSPVPGLPILQVNVFDPEGNHIHVDFDAAEA